MSNMESRVTRGSEAKRRGNPVYPNAEENCPASPLTGTAGADLASGPVRHTCCCAEPHDCSSSPWLPDPPRRDCRARAYTPAHGSLGGDDLVPRHRLRHDPLLLFRRDEPALNDLVEQCLVADLKEAGWLGAVPVHAVEDFFDGDALGRSEERRVGKEWRVRWAG